MKPEELENLLTSHSAALQLYARQWAASPEDCVQQAFIALATADPIPRSPVPWLFRVVKNLAISQQRSESRRRERERHMGEEAIGWFLNKGNHEISTDELLHALNELDDLTREIIVARTWGELNFEEIADLIDRSSSTAHRLYQAGLNELRKQLGLTWLTKK